MPDYNQVLGHLNGNLANVLAWPRALAAYRRIDTIRLMLLFVVTEHRRQGVPAALYLDTIKAALARGYTWAVGSNYDEANAAVSREAARIGGETYAVLRIYERQVGPLSRAQGRVG